MVRIILIAIHEMTLRAPIHQPTGRACTPLLPRSTKSRSSILLTKGGGRGGIAVYFFVGAKTPIRRLITRGINDSRTLSPSPVSHRPIHSTCIQTRQWTWRPIRCLADIRTIPFSIPQPPPSQETPPERQPVKQLYHRTQQIRARAHELFVTVCRRIFADW